MRSEEHPHLVDPVVLVPLDGDAPALETVAPPLVLKRESGATVNTNGNRVTMAMKSKSRSTS